MATKKITKGTDYDFIITQKSKDTTYVFKNETVAENASINFSLGGYGHTYTARTENDLFVICEFYDEKTGAVKVVLNTIKNYFLYNEENADLVTVNDEIVDLSYVSQFVSGTVADESRGIGVVGDKKATTYNLSSVSTNYFDNIYDLGGNDTYNVTAGSYDSEGVNNFPRVTLTDYSGNDKYNIHYAGNLPGDGYFMGSEFEIWEAKGNDTYNIEDEKTYGRIHDLKGKDKYTIKNSSGITIEEGIGKDTYVLENSSDINIYDGYFTGSEYDKLVKSGNDKYEVKNSEGVYIQDTGGKDNYTITNTEGVWIADGYDMYDGYFTEVKSGNDTYELTNVDEAEIDDYDGKDKYTLNGSYDVEIYDHDGKDKFTLNGSDDIRITDYNGADKYTISGGENIYIDDKKGNDKYSLSGEFEEVSIEEREGDDTYTISGGGVGGDVGITDYNGSDKYTFNKTYDAEVWDIRGTDTYKVSESSYIEIWDGYTPEESGNDKYVITDSNNIEIMDVAGDETYTITGSESLTISDHYGNDKYTLSKVNNIHITDNSESNDTYKTDLSGRVVIEDLGGDNDKLTLTSKAKNLIYMANFSNDDENGVADGSLIIFDKAKGGYTIIENYFNTKIYGDDGPSVLDVTTDGVGRIETVKAGKSNITAKIDSFSSTDNILELSASVAGWLSENTGFSSVGQLLENGSETQIQNFITFAQDPYPAVGVD